jgi:hypothetical protein
MNSDITQPPVPPNKVSRASIEIEPPAKNDNAKARADADRKAIEAARDRRKRQKNNARRR